MSIILTSNTVSRMAPHACGAKIDWTAITLATSGATRDNVRIEWDAGTDDVKGSRYFYDVERCGWIFTSAGTHTVVCTIKEIDASGVVSNIQQFTEDLTVNADTRTEHTVGTGGDHATLADLDSALAASATDIKVVLLDEAHSISSSFGLGSRTNWWWTKQGSATINWTGTAGGVLFQQTSSGTVFDDIEITGTAPEVSSIQSGARCVGYYNVTLAGSTALYKFVNSHENTDGVVVENGLYDPETGGATPQSGAIWFGNTDDTTDKVFVVRGWTCNYNDGQERPIRGGGSATVYECTIDYKNTNLLKGCMDLGAGGPYAIVGCTLTSVAQAFMLGHNSSNFTISNSNTRILRNDITGRARIGYYGSGTEYADVHDVMIAHNKFRGRGSAEPAARPSVLIQGNESDNVHLMFNSFISDDADQNGVRVTYGTSFSGFKREGNWYHNTAGLSGADYCLNVQSSDDGVTEIDSDRDNVDPTGAVTYAVIGGVDNSLNDYNANAYASGNTRQNLTNDSGGQDEVTATPSQVTPWDFNNEQRQGNWYAGAVGSTSGAAEPSGGGGGSSNTYVVINNGNGNVIVNIG